MSAERIAHQQPDAPTGTAIEPEPVLPAPLPIHHPFTAPPMKHGHGELHGGLAAAKAHMRLTAAHPPGFKVPHPPQHGNQR